MHFRARVEFFNEFLHLAATDVEWGESTHRIEHTGVSAAVCLLGDGNATLNFAKSDICFELEEATETHAPDLVVHVKCS